jgi:Protein of unknown function (DUF2442)
MLTKVVRLDRLGGFRLRVRFNDGSGGEYDFSAMVNEPGPMLEPFRDETYFVRVFLEFGAPPGRTAATLRRNGYAAKWWPLVN